MRPDVAAFRELDTLVRNLSDQLAGYRRRALAAESRVLELEQRTAALDAAMTAARTEAVEAHTARSGAQVKLREVEERERAAHREAEALRMSHTQALEAVTPAAVDGELARENQRLRERLTEAKERTGLLAERVRFLRQQVGLAVER